MALSGMLGLLRAKAVGDLGQRQSAAFFDRLETERAVAVSPRKYHAYRLLASVPGESAEKDVDRFWFALGQPPELEPPPSIPSEPSEGKT